MFGRILCCFGIHNLCMQEYLNDESISVHLFCDRCGKSIMIKTINQEIFNKVQICVGVAYSEDFKAYEIYGCSNLPLSECADVAQENLTIWFNGATQTGYLRAYVEKPEWLPSIEPHSITPDSIS